MLKNKFEDILSILKNKKILITTHELADLDGLISCCALEHFLNLFLETKKNVTCFSKLSKPTKNFIERFSERFPEIDFTLNRITDFSKFEICLILDTNSLDQIKFRNELELSKIPFIFIDHHFMHKKTINGNFASLNLIHEEFSSTTEIILELFHVFNVELSTPFKILMISAILTDSGFFNYGDNRTIINVSKLLDDDVNFQDIRSLLNNNINISEKIAKIKGMQRVKLFREGEYLVGITNVSSYGASVASTLIKVGFDISIVYSKEKNVFKINTRAKKGVCLKTGLHLGKIFEEMSDENKGNGGGHDGAAFLTCHTESSLIINKILEKVKQYL